MCLVVVSYFAFEDMFSVLLQCFNKLIRITTVCAEVGNQLALGILLSGGSREPREPLQRCITLKKYWATISLFSCMK